LPAERDAFVGRQIMVGYTDGATWNEWLGQQPQLAKDAQKRRATRGNGEERGV